MGYSHEYTYHSTTCPKAHWDDICAKVRLLVANLPEHSTSAGSYYTTDPLKLAEVEIDGDHIFFKGAGGEVVDGFDSLAHEDFLLERRWRPGLVDDLKACENDPQWSMRAKYLRTKIKARHCTEFIKTNRKPYDLVVCAVLAVAHKVANKWLSVTSDGYAHEWADACAWASKVLGEDIPIPAGIREQIGHTINNTVQVGEETH